MPMNSRRLRLLAVTGVATAVMTAAAVPADALTGLDVSQWNHPGDHSITWQQVRATGASFVFIKAAEGTRYVNPRFASDWRASGQAGLLRGTYDYVRPSARRGSAVAQARHFVRVIGPTLRTTSLPPAIDLEVSGGLSPRRLVAWTRTWLTTVQQLTGRTPMIYSYPYFWRHNMRGSRAFRAFPLWGACVCHRPTTFGGAWTHWTFWQYSFTSRIRGITGQTDKNRFNGTTAQLLTLARYSSG